MIEDNELLREFVGDRAEAPFAELVRRHVDLVYGFALRRVNGDAHLASDVTQAVFADLAAKAPSLVGHPALAGWLYGATRFATAKAVRSEQRRRTHEKEAHIMQQINSPFDLNWEELRPVLDEVMDKLNEPDREAVLLRFFQGRSLAEIGRKLATSEDAARMRIDRALDKMRVLLNRHGIASTSAALAVALSSQPSFAAPGGLAAQITVHALTPFASLAAAAAQAGKTIAMTTAQKATLAVTVALVIGTGLYQARLLRAQSGELRAGARQVSAFDARIAELRQQRNATTRDLAETGRRITEVKTRLASDAVPIDADTDAQMRAWAARVDALRQSLAANPQWSIPELQLLTESQWYGAVRDVQLDSTDMVRKALGSLRDTAMQVAAPKIMKALRAYLTANAEAAPSSVNELAPYLDEPIDPKILDRYAIAPAQYLGPAAATVLPPGKPVVTNRTVADLEYDTVIQMNVQSYVPWSALGYYAAKAKEAYAQANAGQMATDPAQLLAYMPQAVDPAKLVQFLKK